MFKKTLNFSELKTDPSVAEMKDGEVLQVFHRGHEVKVIMTQEYFFTLMSRLEKAEGVSKLTAHDSEKLLSEVNNKVSEIRDFLTPKAKAVG